MAHPYASHRDHHVGKDRVSHITHGEHKGKKLMHRKAGGRVASEAEDRNEDEAEGEISRHRSDRPQRKKGGRVKGKTHVNVNVITGGAPQAGLVPHPPMVPPMPAGPPPAPPMMAHPPMGAPPMAGPGPAGPSGLPGMMPRASGGRTVKSGPAWDEGRKNGTQVQHDPGKNDKKDMNRPRVVSFMAGGRVEAKQGVAKATKLPGGAGGGEGRLSKIKKYGPK